MTALLPVSRTRIASLVASLALGSLVACSSAPEAANESVSRASSRVIKGTDSDASQDAVILLVHYDPKVGSFGACTGTMLAPRLVLTARHCVADTDEAAACDVTGEPLAAGVIRKNRAANTMYVFTGPNRPSFGGRDEVKPAGRGAEIIDDGGTNLCNHDIALIVLEEPVENAMISPIRLDNETLVGDQITAVGWGVTDKTQQPDVRQTRTGIAITGVGPQEDEDQMPVPPNEFRVGESICSGDSGGPAIADTGAVIGVVSRGGNQRQQDPQNPAKSCIGGSNLYTKVQPFKDLILSAYEAAEAEPWLEGGPDPRLLKPNAACTDASECRSNRCLGDSAQAAGAKTCAQDCTDGSPCTDGQTCQVVEGVKVCRTPPKANNATATTTGCAVGSVAASEGSSSNVALGLALAGLGLVASRRRRR